MKNGVLVFIVIIAGASPAALQENDDMDYQSSDDGLFIDFASLPSSKYGDFQDIIFDQENEDRDIIFLNPLYMNIPLLSQDYALKTKRSVNDFHDDNVHYRDNSKIIRDHPLSDNRYLRFSKTDPQQSPLFTVSEIVLSSKHNIPMYENDNRIPRRGNRMSRNSDYVYEVSSRDIVEDYPSWHMSNVRGIEQGRYNEEVPNQGLHSMFYAPKDNDMTINAEPSHLYRSNDYLNPTRGKNRELNSNIFSTSRSGNYYPKLEKPGSKLNKLVKSYLNKQKFNNEYSTSVLDTDFEARDSDSEPFTNENVETSPQTSQSSLENLVIDKIRQSKEKKPIHEKRNEFDGIRLRRTVEFKKDSKKKKDSVTEERNNKSITERESINESSWVEEEDIPKFKLPRNPKKLRSYLKGVFRELYLKLNYDEHDKDDN